jgi:phycobilisome rod-core linker protein
VEKLLGRKTNKSEEIAWSIVIATKGVEGLVDVLLDSQEYLDAFGYDTVPSQRNRVLPGRELGLATDAAVRNARHVVDIGAG